MVKEKTGQVDTLRDLMRFYQTLSRLEESLGGKRTLQDCHGRLQWPRRGIYFFFEGGERRSDSGEGLRVTRVGTHAVSTGSRTTLWKRLAQHKGSARSGGGNHRGSIFRLLVGEAMLRRDMRYGIGTWGRGQSAPRDIRTKEHALECEVSTYIGRMPFLWLEVEDEPTANSLRSYIEKNSIALLSNFGKTTSEALDVASESWLGLYSGREPVKRSGLWNNNYVDRPYEPRFIEVLQRLVPSGAASRLL
jgi:hypothetical protein